MGKDEVIRGGLKGDLFQAHNLVDGVVDRLDRMWVGGEYRLRKDEVQRLRDYALKIDTLLYPLLQILEDFDGVSGNRRNPHVEKVKPLKEIKQDTSEQN